MTFLDRFDASAETADGGAYTLHLNGNDIDVRRGDDFTIDGTRIVCDDNGQVTMTSGGGNPKFENNFQQAPKRIVKADVITNLRLD
ncbi:hypothetical protein [Glycomyces sp. YM15]|uniref:hypothetical protein n=1 Tax=Glycomyces sp. YM15 TaxID=2800446 RepID=UPI0019623216|nr:hypothetical protein [Glycomyces sp. YM15]